MPKITRQRATKKTSKPSGKPTDNGSIMDRVVRVDELPDTGMAVLLFGQSGSGKTTLACSFPKPLLLVRPEQVEDGSRSVRTIKGIDVTPFLTSPDDLTDICAYQQKTDKYKTIVIDGVTKFQDCVLKKVMGLKDVPAQLNWGIATQQDWGTVATELKEHLRQLLRLKEYGTNVVILGGEREFGNSGDEDSILFPHVLVALSPSSCGWLHEVMDYNVHTFIRQKQVEKVTKIGDKNITKLVPGKGVDYCLRVGPDAVYQTKFRVPKGTPLPSIVVDPSYTKIKKYLGG